MGCKGSDKTEGLSAHTHTCILHMDLYYFSPINANIHFMLKAISYTFLKLCHKAKSYLFFLFPVELMLH